MRLFVNAVPCVMRALKSMVAVLESVCHVLGGESFLSTLDFWTKSVQGTLVRALLVLLNHEIWWSQLAVIEIRHLIVRHLLVGALTHTFSLLLDGIIHVSPHLLLNKTIDTFFGLRDLVGLIYLQAFGVVALRGWWTWVVPKHVSWVVVLFEHGSVLIIVSDLV